MYAQIVLYTTCTIIMYMYVRRSMYLINYMDIVHCQTTFSSPGYRKVSLHCTDQMHYVSYIGSFISMSFSR
jgi:hypothetical protein